MPNVFWEGRIPSLYRDSHIAPEWQPHVAFDGWTLQSTAELPFAEITLRRKQQQKSHGLASVQDESLTAIE